MSNETSQKVVKKPKRTLSDRALKVVGCVEKAFWETGETPTYEVIARDTGENVDYVRGTLERNKLARKALAVRGVDLLVPSKEDVLTPQQLLAANVILNSHDKRSLREKLEFIGVSSQQWHAWMRQPGFSSYIEKRAEEAFKGNDWLAYSALQENLEEGKLDAVKFHFEMRGKYKQSVDVNVNIEHVLMKVVEVISRHVSDEEVLLAIAGELSELDSGEQAALPVGKAS
jgi:hypothetical protein